MQPRDHHSQTSSALTSVILWPWTRLSSVHFRTAVVPAFLCRLGFSQTCCLISSHEGTLIISLQNSTQQLPASSKFWFVDISFEALLRWSPFPFVGSLAVSPVKSFGYPRLCHFDLIFPHSRAVYTHFNVWLLSAVTGNIKINDTIPVIKESGRCTLNSHSAWNYLKEQSPFLRSRTILGIRTLLPFHLLVRFAVSSMVHLQTGIIVTLRKTHHRRFKCVQVLPSQVLEIMSL